MSAVAHTGVHTEIEFEFPRGLCGRGGNAHGRGT